jgi:hypothetical protein
VLPPPRFESTLDLVVVEAVDDVAVDDDGDCASLQGLGVEGRKYDDIGRNDERYTSSSGSNQPTNQPINTDGMPMGRAVLD